MNKNILCWILFLVYAPAIAQHYSSSSIFAHNDYIQPIPFHNAYQQQVGYIEADVFLGKDNLFVAHTRQEIDKEKTLEELYFKPLRKVIVKNKGFAYADTSKQLVLMIDLKTAGVPTLDFLVKKLKKYPELITSPTFKIAISGDMPAPAAWENYPGYIYFDGRPGISYSKEELARISMISTNFTDHTKWNGKGVLTKADETKIAAIIDAAHKKGKKIRFWGSPDFNNAWIAYMKLGVDVLNSDNVSQLARFLKDFDKNTYQEKSPHELYQSKADQTVNYATPKNVILMIGDGMGLTQLYSGYTANRGQLNIFNIQNIGFSVTTASDSYITDSAAGGTAMATGSKTNNRHVGVDDTGKILVPITEVLKQKGYGTAVISNGDITDATPAAFYGHQPERSMSEAIAADFMNSNVDILVGGGTKAFKNRKDNRDLLEELAQKKYKVSESFTDIDRMNSTKVVIIDDEAAKSKKAGRGDFLTNSLLKSVELLSQDEMSFFVMIEGAQIDWGGHQNDLEYVVREVLDFDQAVGAAMKYVDENEETLLIITADHETGGLSLLGGDIENGYVHGNFSTTDHTAVMVPVFSYGPGAELFKGVYQNTDIYNKILEVLNFE